MLQRKTSGNIDVYRHLDNGETSFRNFFRPKRTLRYFAYSQTFSAFFIGFMWYRLKINGEFRRSCHHNAPFILNMFYRSLYYIEGDTTKKADYEQWGVTYAADTKG